MKLHQLRALAAVADAGSIQEASRVLHVTQPALSKAIKELETSVGATLFVRSSKGIRLTPMGQRLVGHARLISENVRRARDDLEDMKGTVVSEISFGVTPVTALMRPVASVLDTFRREFPAARLRIQELRPAQLLEQVREGMMDFALTSQLLPADRGLDCTPVCRVPSVIGARKGHPLLGSRLARASAGRLAHAGSAQRFPFSLSDAFRGRRARAAAARGGMHVDESGAGPVLEIRRAPAAVGGIAAQRADPADHRLHHHRRIAAGPHGIARRA
jgi:DNA-binding transcriptional LysR family regulator